MAPLLLEGDTLGQKHQHYNKLVHEAVLNKHAIETSLSGDDDVQNLLKIDVACKTRNVEFLLQVLKSEDLLYVSRAIKNCQWLVTEKKYSHIVSPEYLYTHLSPEMTTRAFNKLMLSVRLNLKDEDRAEAFYKYIAERNRKTSFKWLQHCSVDFIDKEIKQHGEDIPHHILRRLVERSLSIFVTFMKTTFFSRYRLMLDTIFLVSIDTEKYLDAIEGIDNNYLHIKYSQRATTTLMTRCPNRILDKFEFYLGKLHLPTFAKHLKEKHDIETLLLRHAENENLQWFYTYSNLEHFIKHMSKKSRYEFVKKIFIDKERLKSQEDVSEDCVPYSSDMPVARCGMNFKLSTNNQNTYQWYKFAPFDVAFTGLKKLIRAESSPTVRNMMLQVLLTCAGQNMTYIRTLLKYYHQKHINEPFKFKIQFVNTFVSKRDTYKFDDETWGLLNQIYQSMEVYIESENSTQSCIKSIIIRHVLRGEKVPDIINKNFVFDNLKEYRHRIKKLEEKDAVFAYLYETLLAKNEAQKISIQSELEDAIQLCTNIFNLLNDWEKDLQNYPYVIKRVKDLIRIKQENSWNTPLNSLYDDIGNKSWKKYMFEESISLSPSEDVCVNALKHDPGLLLRHIVEIEAMLNNDALSLTCMLSKVKIYWLNSLAEDWKKIYFNRLEQPRGYKSTAIGLCTLLNQKQLNDVAKKYAPSENKIDWNEINEHVLNLQKQIAKNMSKARPLLPLEIVLWYARGDYLQFVVPTINSILSQLSASKTRVYLPKLLEAPVSLKKFGVRVAFDKLNSMELKPIFTEIWNSTKNSTIRTVLFTQTHALLSKEKNTAFINDIWELLSMFIDNLSSEENNMIYKILGKAPNAPASIRPQFFMKSYTFLKSLPAKANCESIIRDMEYNTPDIMESLDDDFVINIMLKSIDKNFTKCHDTIHEKVRMITSFVLSCKDEKTAARRYELFLGPLLDRNLPLWNETHDRKYHVKINLKEILTKLFYYIDVYNLNKKLHIPVETFQKIQSKLEGELSPLKDYTFLTSCKMAVEFIKLLHKHKDALNKLSIEEINESQNNEKREKSYTEMHTVIAPYFAKYCVQLLTEDLNNLYSSIFILFSQGLEDFFNSFLSRRISQNADNMLYLKWILQSSNNKEVYLAVYPVLPLFLVTLYTDDDIKKMNEIRKILFSHPSEELKMHYFELYRTAEAEDWIEEGKQPNL